MNLIEILGSCKFFSCLRILLLNLQLDAKIYPPQGRLRGLINARQVVALELVIQERVVLLLL